uniref:Putative reverse transcriptase domain, Zinc finger, CCHC-type, Aspartic peptidase domain protein n=1 Tax=Helianthus annuus TaxID=4232 RepID=A0A251VEY4_HELAN
MIMAANAYKANGNNEAQILTMIVSGFTGILKGWWDKYLTEEEKHIIQNAKKLIIKTENNVQIPTETPDIINTLIFAIIKHFIGNPTDYQERNSLILLNLTCRKLQDFRWYKDVFLSKVMTRDDCKESYWKERFIAGLPKLFAERIREKIKKDFNNNIPYRDLSYGQIINYINQEGLKICNDLKLKEKIKRDGIQGHKELGSFCQQYGLEPFKNPSKSKKKIPKQFIRKNYKRKPYIKNKQKYYKDKIDFQKKKQGKQDIVICYKCGRQGHYSKDCYTKKKINELNISDELKEQINKILIYDNSSENSISDYSDNDLNNIEDSNSESSSEDNMCECIGPCICEIDGTINSLTENNKDLFELLEKIDDKEVKQIYLKQLKEKYKLPIEKEEKVYNFNEICQRFQTKQIKENHVTITDLQIELKNIKEEIREIKSKIKELEKGENKKDEENNNNTENIGKINHLKGLTSQKWYTKLNIIVNNEFRLTLVAMIDSGADMNCIQEGLIPTKYYEKTTYRLSGANGNPLNIKYKLTNVHICKENYCYKTQLVLVKDLTSQIILGLPFITQLYPFTVEEKGISIKVLNKRICFEFAHPITSKQINILSLKEKQKDFLIEEIDHVRIKNQLQDKMIIKRIQETKNKFKDNICANIPNAFWERKRHIVRLPYIKDFNERNIPTKSKAIHMSQELEGYCKKEIQELLDKKLIRPSKSPWSCSAFYVQNNAELERGAPRLVINYKPLNKVLEWIRYPIPNKRDLLKRIYDSKIFSKFDMKSGFWQVQIAEEDRYKTGFNVPFGHYEWNVMPFGLKNAPSEFQNIMNDIILPLGSYAIVYIDDVLIFSNSLDQHFKHLNAFYNIIHKSGLVVSPSKMSLFQTEIRFLGHNIIQGTIKPIKFRIFK